MPDPHSLIAEIRASVDERSLGIECYACSGDVCLLTEDIPSELSHSSICEVQVGPWLELQLTVEELHSVLCRRPHVSSSGVLLLGLKAFVRLEPLSNSALGLCADLGGYLEPESTAALPFLLRELSAQPILWRTGVVTAQLLQEPSPLNLALAIAGYRDDYNPPHVEEVCLELTFPESPAEQDVTSLVSAYLYQLSLLGYDFKPSGPPPLLDEMQPFSLPPATGGKLGVGPLFMEASIQPLLQYYAKGVARLRDYDFEFAFLNFYKVLEHACGVITLRKMNEWIKAGPRTVRALKGMSGQLSDDAMVVALISDLRLPPSMQQKARRLANNTSASLPTILSSTRNYYSHAKAGYPLRGCEILEPGLCDGCALIRQLAEKVIDWYAALPATEKLS